MMSEGEEDIEGDKHRMDYGTIPCDSTQRKRSRIAGKDPALGLGCGDEEWLPNGEVTGSGACREAV